MCQSGKPLAKLASLSQKMSSSLSGSLDHHACSPLPPGAACITCTNCMRRPCRQRRLCRLCRPRRPYPTSACPARAPKTAVAHIPPQAHSRPTVLTAPTAPTVPPAPTAASPGAPPATTPAAVPSPHVSARIVVRTPSNATIAPDRLLLSCATQASITILQKQHRVPFRQQGKLIERSPLMRGPQGLLCTCGCFDQPEVETGQPQIRPGTILGCQPGALCEFGGVLGCASWLSVQLIATVPGCRHSRQTSPGVPSSISASQHEQPEWLS